MTAHIEIALETLSGALYINEIPNHDDKMKRIREIIFEDQEK